MEILPLPSQYILSLLLFITNRNQFLINSEKQHIDTRQRANFQQPSVNLTQYQKEVVIQVFNMLPSYIKIESDNPKKFKLILQKFVYDNSFYSLDEYFELQKKLNLFIYDLNQYLKVWHIQQIYICVSFFFIY